MEESNRQAKTQGLWFMWCSGKKYPDVSGVSLIKSILFLPTGDKKVVKTLIISWYNKTWELI